MKKAAPWLVLIVALLAAGAWYVLSPGPADTHPSVIDILESAPEVETPVAQYPVEEIRPAVDPPPEPDPLPGLEDSDSLMIEALAGLLGPESLDAYFVLQQIVSRIVATVDSLPSRKIAPLVMPLKPVGGAFRVVAGDDAVTISPDNAARYAPYVRLVEAVDTAEAVTLYLRFYPLFQEAYEALGYPDAYFNDRLVEVIDHLLATPIPAIPIHLAKPEAVYLYEDEGLEALSAGQKLLVRMGTDNAGAVRSKLYDFRAYISREDL